MPKKATRKRQPKKVAKSEQRFPSIEFSPDTLLDEFDGQGEAVLVMVGEGSSGGSYMAPLALIL